MGVFSYLRWTTANALTAYSALYPPAFGDTIAFAYELDRSYQMMHNSSWRWTFVGSEVQEFARQLLEDIPSQEEIIKEAEDTREFQTG